MAPKHKRCVFVSAGNHHNVMSWVEGLDERPWDLFVAFYGNDKTVYAELEKISDDFVALEGSKFQNLYKIFFQHPEKLYQYSHIWVADDDLILNSIDIEKLFRIAETYDFWVLQPAFEPTGRVSHEITMPAGENIRIVNFVEVTCPLFRADKLFEFLHVYDGKMVGWGIDWWYCHHFDSNRHFKFAVVDFITMLNPEAWQRPGGIREIETLQPSYLRHQSWLELSARLHQPEFPHRTLATITQSLPE